MAKEKYKVLYMFKGRRIKLVWKGSLTAKLSWRKEYVRWTLNDGGM